MPTKRTLTRQLADLQRRYANAIDERDEARKRLESRQWVEQHITSSRDDLVITRTKERDAYQRLLHKTEDQLAEARQRLADRPTPAQELRDARRALMLERRAVTQLTARLDELQAANEALYRSGALAGTEVSAS